MRNGTKGAVRRDKRGRKTKVVNAKIDAKSGQKRNDMKREEESKMMVQDWGSYERTSND